MPRGDGTGPAGMGPMTGRRAGYCAGFDQPGFANPAAGYGLGLGRGMRRGFFHHFGRGFRPHFGFYPMTPEYYGSPVQPATPSREQELGYLKAQATAWERELRELNRRIEELESKSE